MKMKHYGGYAVVMATVGCSLLSISAMAQTSNNDPTFPDSIPRSTPPADIIEQDPTGRSNDLTQPTPFDPLQSRDNAASLPLIGADRQPQNPSLDVGQYDRSGVLSRHMVDRTRQILVLRRLLALRFSADDIAVALPLLRRLNDIKAAPPVDPERALDSEYEALLAARPGDPLPPSSAIKITDAARYYREEQSKIWGEMARRLGRSKADGLYNLLGQQDQAATPLSSGAIQRRPSYTAPESSRPGSVYKRSGMGATGYGTQSLPLLEVPDDRNRIDPVDIAPSVAVPEPDLYRGRALSLPEADLSGAAPLGASNQVPGPNPRNRRSPAPARDPYQGDTLYPTPESPRNYVGRRALPNQSSDYSLLVYSPTTIRISLPELIDLMQTKLNVMSRTERGEGLRP